MNVLDPDTMRLLRDIITLVIGAGLFVWSVRKTADQIMPLIVPALKWVRKKFLEEHTREEEAKIESIRQDLLKHERRQAHEQDP